MERKKRRYIDRYGEKERERERGEHRDRQRVKETLLSAGVDEADIYTFIHLYIYI